MPAPMASTLDSPAPPPVGAPGQTRPPAGMVGVEAVGADAGADAGAVLPDERGLLTLTDEPEACWAAFAAASSAALRAASSAAFRSAWLWGDRLVLRVRSAPTDEQLSELNERLRHLLLD